MKNRNNTLGVPLILLMGMASATPALRAQEQAAPSTVPVHLVVTVEPLREADNTVDPLNREDVKVQQGKNRLQVTDRVPARGEQAAPTVYSDRRHLRHQRRWAIR